MARWRCQDCPALFGAWLSRCPRCGSAKELVVALSVCTSCTTKFAVGLPKCPHCGSTEYVEDGQPMAKITAHGGPSDKTLPAEPNVEGPLDVTEYLVAAAEPMTEEGGEESSPGTSSSTSTETQQPKSEPSSKPRRKPARKTASPSAPDPMESSSAPSTDGEKTDGSSATETAE